MAVWPAVVGSCTFLGFLLLTSLTVRTVGSHDLESAGSTQQELEVVGRILSVFAKQEKDPCIPRGRILAIIQTAKPRLDRFSLFSIHKNS